MKSLQVLFILSFVGFIFCQVQVGRLYSEMNTVRAKHCLPAIRRSAELEQAALVAATAQCNGQSFRIPAGTYPFTGTFQSSAPATSESAINNAVSFYQTSLRSWTCTTDSGSGWAEFVRQSLVSGQEVGCAFSPLVCRGRNVYNLLCIFRTPAPPQGRFVVPRARCTSCQGASTTTTGGTPTTTGGIPTTTTTGGTPTTTGSTPTTTGGTPTTTGSTTGGSTGNEVRDIHLQKINAARSCLGLGSLAWDDNLARRAQDYANRLAASCGGLSHSSPQERGDEGENLWMVGGGTKTAAIERGNDLWNGEAVDFNCGSNTCAAGKACGHYTQNVWANTKRLGCGVAQCSRGYYGVCRYGPPGNYIGEHPFGTAKCSAFEQCKRGAAAGRALSNTSPSTAQNPSTRFFESDSQIVVFALAIFIVVVVVAILVLVVIITKRRGANRDLEYQLLENK